MGRLKGLTTVALSLIISLLVSRASSFVLLSERAARHHNNVTEGVKFSGVHTMVYFADPHLPSLLDYGGIPEEHRHRIREGELISLVKIVSGKFKRILFTPETDNTTNIAEVSNAVAKFNKYHRSHVTVYPTEPLVQLWVHIPFKPNASVNSHTEREGWVDKLRTSHWEAVRDSMDRANHLFPGSVEGVIFNEDNFLDNRNHSNDRLASAIASVNRIFGTETEFPYQISLNFSNLTIFTDGKMNHSVFRALNETKACCAFFSVDTSNVNEDVNVSLAKRQTAMNKTARVVARLMTAGRNDSSPPRVITPIFTTGYGSDNKAGRSYEDLVHYWGSMGEWATRTNTKVALVEAFDIPARQSPVLSSLGWWTLAEDPYEGEVFKEKWEILRDSPAAAELVVQDAVNASYLWQEEVFNFRENNFLSVVFDPRMRTAVGDYSGDVLLDKLSEKFSRILVGGASLPFEEALGFPIYLAEWNAKREKRAGGKPITASVTFSAPNNTLDPRDYAKELMILSESANRMYQGTVSSILMSFDENFNHTEKIPLYVGLVVKAYTQFEASSNTSSTPIKFGIELPLNSCKKFDAAIEPILHFVKIVTLTHVSTSMDLKQGVVKTTTKIIKTFDACRNRIKGFFGSETPAVEVFLNVGWPGSVPGGERDEESMVRFWGEMATWAKSQQVGVVFTEAFDKPRESSSNDRGRLGWWETVSKPGGVGYDFVEKRELLLEQLPNTRGRNGDVSQDPAQVTETAATEETPSLINTAAMSEEEWWLWVYWVVPTVAVVILSLVLAFLITWKIKRNKRQLTKEEVAEFFGGSSRFKDNLGEELYINSKYQEEQHEIPLQNINFDSVIGSGKYAMAYKACLGESSVVVVKTPKKECTKQYFKCMLLEVKIMSGIGSHGNVLKFLGAITKDIRKGMVYTITEYCSNGTLHSHLRTTRYNLEATEDENAKKFEDVQELYKFASEIAAGMHYLSEKDVIHGDLSSVNVLLDGKNVCKICNFGLTRKLDENGEYLKRKEDSFPWRWIALETLKHKIVTSKSDIWSFGVTLWEIFSLGRIPYKSHMQDGFLEKVERGLRLKRPKYATQDVYDNMMQCWNKNPTDRPQFKEQSEYFLLLMKEESDQDQLPIGQEL